jgi:hypothetical protein
MPGMNKSVPAQKKVGRQKRRWIVCRACKRRERNVTPHNAACGRCWPCHKKDPCIIDNDGDSF